MLHWICQFCIFNIPETLFIMLMILFSFNNKFMEDYQKNILFLLIISAISMVIQNLEINKMLINFLNMLIYYIVFKFFYQYKNRKKLICSILFIFCVILFSEIIIYSPLFLFFNLNLNVINNNIFYSIICLIPIYCIEFIILFLIYKKGEMCK